jgi:hypothetical protein
LADFNFAAAEDWGCTSNTDATVSNINGKNPVRVFGLGDYSYASTGTCWFNKIANSSNELEKVTFAEGFSGITDLEVGPDGYLYVLSYAKGTIYRTSPT